MSFIFKKNDIKKIGSVLGVRPISKGNNIRFEVGGNRSSRKLSLEIYSNIRIGSRMGNLITVYTENAHLQLHFCSGYVISKMLNEVTFIGENDGKLSGLIIEKVGGCSLYANVDRTILSGDFTQLGPEVMLSGIALSLSESILPSPATDKKQRRNK